MALEGPFSDWRLAPFAAIAGQLQPLPTFRLPSWRAEVLSVLAFSPGPPNMIGNLESDLPPQPSFSLKCQSPNLTRRDTVSNGLAYCCLPS